MHKITQIKMMTKHTSTKGIFLMKKCSLNLARFFKRHSLYALRKTSKRINSPQKALITAKSFLLVES